MLFGVIYMGSIVCLHAGSPAVAAAAVKSWPCYNGCNGSIKASQYTTIVILKTLTFLLWTIRD